MKSYWIIFLLFFIASCTKLVTVGPPNTALTSQNTYTDDQTAASVLTGIYTNLALNSPLFGSTLSSLSLLGELSADGLTLFGGAANANGLLVPFYQNLLTSGEAGSPPANIWSSAYSNIYTLNIALENLSVSDNLTPSVKRQLIGEAKFMRAFFYFYLTNLFGNVPLTTTSNNTINASLIRSGQDQVYQQIISDLKDAESYLSDAYMAADAMTETQQRLRPNKWTATAFLARVYLYNKKYDSAESLATSIINHTSLYTICPILNSVFLENSTEAIWQLQPVNSGWNTEDARFFILPATGPTESSPAPVGYPVYLSEQILNAFESGDTRRANWVDSVMVDGLIYYYPYKYKSATLNAPITEYTMVFRLGEQYLIRAEARASQNNISGAQEDLNIIRTRAGLPNTSANNQSSMATAILHERQVELFTEWGNRWFDLKRTGNIDNVMSTVAPEKGTVWNTNWQLYPIPLYDITQDPNLTQNAGY